jgi:hypothetical protein
MTKKQEHEALEAAWLNEGIARLYRCNSFERADCLLGYLPAQGYRPGALWFRLFGEGWTSCDGMGARRARFAQVLQRATRRQLDAMMSESERQRFKELPETIRAFRGCEAHDRSGISFSLCEHTARSFPFLNRYLAKAPALIIADIPKDRAVLKLDREEQEIIACGKFSIVAVEILQAEAPQVLGHKCRV